MTKQLNADIMEDIVAVFTFESYATKARDLLLSAASRYHKNIPGKYVSY